MKFLNAWMAIGCLWIVTLVIFHIEMWMNDGEGCLDAQWKIEFVIDEDMDEFDFNPTYLQGDIVEQTPERTKGTYLVEPVFRIPADRTSIRWVEERQDPMQFDKNCIKQNEANDSPYYSTRHLPPVEHAFK